MPAAAGLYNHTSVPQQTRFHRASIACRRMSVPAAPTKRSKVHPQPVAAAQQAWSSPAPELQLMDVSQQVRTSASIHRYHGSCHAVLDGLNINDGTGVNYRSPRWCDLPPL